MQSPSQIVALGRPAQLSVAAQGAPPLAYQWRHNGANIPGATNAAYAIAAFDLSDAGNYSVAIANRFGIAVSPAIRLFPSLAIASLADNFAARVTLTNSAFTGAGDNRSSTKEPGEPNHAGNPGGKSVWFRWMPLVSGIATISTAGSTFDTLLAVYQGSNLTNLMLVAQDDDSSGFFTSGVRFNVVADESSEVAIDGLAGASGDIILKLEIEPTPDRLPEILVQPTGKTVPPGILVALAVTARAGSPALGLTYHWLKDGVEILNETNSTYSIPNMQAENVGAYSVRITQGPRVVQSQSAVLQINTSTIGTLVDNVAAADKFAHAVLAAKTPPIQPPGPDGPLPPRTPPAIGYSGTQIFNTVGASKDEGEPNHCGILGGASQWIYYQAPSDGIFILNTDGSGFDTVLAVYTNNGPVVDFTNLVSVACDNDGGLDGHASAVAFAVTRNTLFYVAVDGVGSAMGRVQLNYKLVVPLRFTSWSYTGGQFQLQFAGQPAGSFILQRSSTLTNWITLLITNSASGIVIFTDINLSGFDRRYYRAFQAQ